MSYRTTHVLFAPPQLIDGVLHRGVMGTDQPRLIHEEMERELWTVLLFFHAPLIPRFESEIDLYVTSPSFADQCPDPKVMFSDRDLVDENEYLSIECEKEFDVIFNVNWLPFKRHELMIETLQWAADQGRPISCLWFGYHYNGLWHDREAMLRAEVEKRGLNVTFAESNFELDVVNHRYNISRCAVNCSEQEGGPRTMSESMLTGIPFIVTNDTFGGCPELMEPQAGLVCDPTPESFAKAIWYAVDHPDEFSPRDWALQNLCRRVTIERLRTCVADLSRQTGKAINVDDIAFRGYDWEHHNGLIRKTEAEFARSKA